MKTYKTWEVIKMLSENPKLKFKSGVSTEQTISLNSEEYLHLDCEGCSDEINNNIGVNDEWELIKEPISFMEAIKLYKEGKTIICEYDGNRYIYEIISCDSNYNTIKDIDGDEICIGEILNGKWYLEE